MSYAKWRVFKGFQLCCSYEVAPEQKARTTYDNILRLVKDDPDVYDAIKFLRAREIVHFQRFGDALSSYTNKNPLRKIDLYIPFNFDYVLINFNSVNKNICDTLFIF